MGDMLSKEEIEALLSAVSEGKVPLAKGGEEKSSYKKTAISYNFKRPLLVSKEQIRVLELIHSDFTRDYAVKLSNYLRTTVEIEIADIEQLTYTEFIASLSEPTSTIGLKSVIDFGKSESDSTLCPQPNEAVLPKESSASTLSICI